MKYKKERFRLRKKYTHHKIKKKPRFSAITSCFFVKAWFFGYFYTALFFKHIFATQKISSFQ